MKAKVFRGSLWDRRANDKATGHKQHVPDQSITSLGMKSSDPSPGWPQLDHVIEQGWEHTAGVAASVLPTPSSPPLAKEMVLVPRAFAP